MFGSFVCGRSGFGSRRRVDRSWKNFWPGEYQCFRARKDRWCASCGWLYFGTSYGLYFSSNNGDSWIDKTFDLDSNRFSILSLITIDSLVYAGTSKDGIISTSNKGDNWKDLEQSKSISQVLSFATLDKNIFAGSRKGGVYLSKDKGNTWNQINDGLKNLTIYTLGIKGKYIYAGTFGGLYRAELRDFGIVNDVSETKNNELSFSLFPNPVSDYFNISINFDVPSPVKINIFNELGISVLEKSFTGANCKIETKDLPPGLFICSVNFAGNLLTKRFVIIK